MPGAQPLGCGLHRLQQLLLLAGLGKFTYCTLGVHMKQKCCSILWLPNSAPISPETVSLSCVFLSPMVQVERSIV
jgi:hypothetical protein